MMMRLVVWVMLVPLLTAQAEVDVQDLDENPEAYHGEVVSITGEVVGDYGIRADIVWIQLNSDAYSDTPLTSREDAVGTNAGMGVRYPRSLHDPAWGEPGGYRTRGPIVRVVGVFRYHDAVESGETFVDASHIELVSPAQPIEVPEAEPLTWIVALGLGLAGGVLYVSARLNRRPLG
jgi:hypothetical protein